LSPDVRTAILTAGLVFCVLFFGATVAAVMRKQSERVFNLAALRC